MKRIAILVIVTCSLVACKPAATPPAPPAPPPPQRIREPAVAGLFYPKEPAVLSKLIDIQLAQASDHKLDGQLRAVICPHAGYEFSGPIAAQSYRLLRGSGFTNVIIFAASHYAYFPGASVSDVEAYRTPLGLMPVSPKAKELAKLKPFELEPHVSLKRPAWADQSSKSAPPLGQDTPDTWEHSVEVQVPFLQKVLPNASIIPIVTGEVDTSEMAKVLEKFLNDKTLLLVSTDLSHYFSYDDAEKRDSVTVDSILADDIAGMKESGDACGKTPVLALLQIAKDKGWKAKLLDYRNSGDTTGKKDGVVGYAAIAFYSPNHSSAHQTTGNFSEHERRQLLRLARHTLRGIVNGQLTMPPEPDSLPKSFTEEKGCFVTLTKNGHLRGCIGHILPQEALYRAVMDNAISAAMRDSRFSPVQAEELPEIEVEISVLTVPVPLEFSSPEELLAKLQPNKDGVVLQMDGHGATYLPQVWEQIPDKVVFLNSLAQKAGCDANAWRKAGTKVSIYQVESFKESEL
jgi:MEMO1 family protein